jgi:GTP-binding protein YchF
MRIGLIGLSGSGKTTCFEALTGMKARHGAAGDNVAVVTVPEPRVDRIAEIYHSRKLTYPEVVFFDTPALETGHGPEAVEKQLARLAVEVEALALVVQCFGDLDHAGSPLDPRGELEVLLLELALADLSMLQRRLERVRGQQKKDRNVYEEHFLERLEAHLAEGHPAFRMGMTAEEEKLLRGTPLITMKPLMVVANVADDDLEDARGTGAMEVAAAQKLPGLHFCATLEAEIAQLPTEDQAAFLADYGLSEPARARFIRTAYELLDVITFLTGGPTEAHAWTIKRDLKAPQAAGKIHTDFEQGFIRAEVVPFADLDQYGTMAECRKHGTVRLEGKEYVVQDGDILDIRFSR